MASTLATTAGRDNCSAQAAALRSAEASLSSKASSTLRSSTPSISSTVPANTFFLPFLATVSRPSPMANQGMALAMSRTVIPGRRFPENRTSTDSGISSGMKPSAPAKATSPEPAGKEIPSGKRVCESPPVPTVSGSSIRFTQE